MGKLKNTFSWSFSAANAFEVCRRKHYWNKYGMWGGWSKSAPAECQAAYRLKKMDNLYSLMGKAAEESVMWVLHRSQEGKSYSAETAYNKIAREYLNRSWMESKNEKWRKNPKDFCCLHEHYYQTLSESELREKTERVKTQTKSCIANFIEHTLPRLEGVKRAQEIKIRTPEEKGDPEHFMFEDVKIYAIPDYVYRSDDKFNIIDWKAGKPREKHNDQIAIYGLWAHINHSIPADDIIVCLEYLNQGKVALRQISSATLAEVRKKIEKSVAAMTEYLVDFDRQKNQPLPRDEWEMCSDIEHCQRFCNFYELCRDELGETPF